MIIRKKNPALSPAIRPALERIFWLGLALRLFVALLTYSGSDSSWSTWTSKTHLSNWMGRSGSVIADLFCQILGLGSFAVCILLALTAFRKSEEEHSLPYLGPVLWLLSLSAILQRAIPRTWNFWQLQNPGGLVG